MKKPVKRRGLRASAGRMKRGLFGPDKKTIEAVRTGLKKRNHGPDPRVTSKLATKYALDAMNITSPGKRKRIHKIIQELSTSRNFAEASGPRAKLKQELGNSVLTTTFLGLWTKKSFRIVKELELLDLLE